MLRFKWWTSILLSVLLWTNLTAETYILVHPTGFEGSDLIHPFLNNNIDDEDHVIWLSSNEDQEWPFEFDYDEEFLAPSGIPTDLDLTGQVILCGGYYRACFKNAVLSFKDSDAEFIIPSEGVYYYSTRTLEDQMNENDLSEQEALDLINAGEKFRIQRPEGDSDAP